MQEEYERLKDTVGQLRTLLNNRKDELLEADRLVEKYDKQIMILSRQLKNKPAGKLHDELAQSVTQGYRPASGDILDEMLGQYINNSGCPVPIQKIGDGHYLFGTKKIYAKILFGKLVIRVGGGYMVIEEFISNYAEKELKILDARQNAAESAPPVNQSAAMKHSDLRKSANMRKSPSPRGSPPRGSPRDKNKQHFADVVYAAQPNVAVSGTHHAKKVTETMLNKMRNSASGAIREIK